MSRVYVLVEGQTEEAFVRELLIPYGARFGCYLHPIIVSTSPGHKGGVVSYAKIKPQIMRLCLQDRDAYVTTMFDLYALPTDFPGKNAPNYPNNGSGHQKAAFLETQLGQDIGQANCLPNLIVHEFEALLFTEVVQFTQWTDDDFVARSLEQALVGKSSPEDINDSPQTAPSKRILAVMPQYQKTFHGPLIACDIGLDPIRNICPHFHAWLTIVEALP